MPWHELLRVEIALLFLGFAPDAWERTELRIEDTLHHRMTFEGTIVPWKDLPAFARRTHSTRALASYHRRKAPRRAKCVMCGGSFEVPRGGVPKRCPPCERVWRWEP